jgi:hypothetical protein
VIQHALERWTIADLAEMFHEIDEHGEEETFTHQWVIWHLMEHDVHHRGEISFILGMHGLTTIDLEAPSLFFTRGGDPLVSVSRDLFCFLLCLRLPLCAIRGTSIP